MKVYKDVITLCGLEMILIYLKMSCQTISQQFVGNPVLRLLGWRRDFEPYTHLTRIELKLIFIEISAPKIFK